MVIGEISCLDSPLRLESRMPRTLLLLAFTRKDFIDDLSCLPKIKYLHLPHSFIVDKKFSEKLRDYMNSHPGLVVDNAMIRCRLVRRYGTLWRSGKSFLSALSRCHKIAQVEQDHIKLPTDLDQEHHLALRLWNEIPLFAVATSKYRPPPLLILLFSSRISTSGHVKLHFTNFS